MSRQTINDTFTLQVPDHFEILADDDLRKMYRSGDPFGWGALDTENHVIITVLWKQYPALLSWMLDLKSVDKKNEQLTGKAHAEHGYRFLEFFSMESEDHVKAEGYRFAYDKEGVTQVCSSYLVKDGRTIYAFLCIGREENMDADKETFRRIMDTLKYA